MLNVEIKARTFNPDQLEEILLKSGAEYVGLDYQKDIYYQVKAGRLKLRVGNIENSLIYYERADQKEAKSSHFELARFSPDIGIENVLFKALDVKVIVEKQRKIFYLQNLKIHIDHLNELGDFVEIEARDMEGEFSETELYEHCQNCMQQLNIKQADLIDISYSDMIMALNA
jgi:predicted adenylyl cyclase CyaB